MLTAQLGLRPAPGRAPLGTRSVFAIVGGPNVTIGRESIGLPDELISRLHATIRAVPRDGGLAPHLYVTRLSKNTMNVICGACHGARVLELETPVALDVGDRVQLYAAESSPLFEVVWGGSHGHDGGAAVPVPVTVTPLNPAKPAVTGPVWHGEQPAAATTTADGVPSRPGGDGADAAAALALLRRSFDVLRASRFLVTRLVSEIAAASETATAAGSLLEAIAGGHMLPRQAPQVAARKPPRAKHARPSDNDAAAIVALNARVISATLRSEVRISLLRERLVRRGAERTQCVNLASAELARSRPADIPPDLSGLVGGIALRLQRLSVSPPDNSVTCELRALAALLEEPSARFRPLFVDLHRSAPSQAPAIQPLPHSFAPPAVISLARFEACSACFVAAENAEVAGMILPVHGRSVWSIADYLAGRGATTAGADPEPSFGGEPVLSGQRAGGDSMTAMFWMAVDAYDASVTCLQESVAACGEGGPDTDQDGVLGSAHASLRMFEAAFAAVDALAPETSTARTADRLSHGSHPALRRLEKERSNPLVITAWKCLRNALLDIARRSTGKEADAFFAIAVRVSSFFDLASGEKCAGFWMQAVSATRLEDVTGGAAPGVVYAAYSDEGLLLRGFPISETGEHPRFVRGASGVLVPSPGQVVIVELRFGDGRRARGAHRVVWRTSGGSLAGARDSVYAGADVCVTMPVWVTESESWTYDVEVWVWICRGRIYWVIVIWFSYNHYLVVGRFCKRFPWITLQNERATSRLGRLAVYSFAAPLGGGGVSSLGVAAVADVAHPCVVGDEDDIAYGTTPGVAPGADAEVDEAGDPWTGGNVAGAAKALAAALLARATKQREADQRINDDCHALNIPAPSRPGCDPFIRFGSAADRAAWDRTMLAVATQLLGGAAEGGAAVVSRFPRTVARLPDLGGQLMVVVNFAGDSRFTAQVDIYESCTWTDVVGAMVGECVQWSGNGELTVAGVNVWSGTPASSVRKQVMAAPGDTLSMVAGDHGLSFVVYPVAASSLPARQPVSVRLRCVDAAGAYVMTELEVDPLTKWGAFKARLIAVVAAVRGNGGGILVSRFAGTKPQPTSDDSSFEQLGSHCTEDSLVVYVGPQRVGGVVVLPSQAVLQAGVSEQHRPVGGGGASGR